MPIYGRMCRQGVTDWQYDMMLMDWMNSRAPWDHVQRKENPVTRRFPVAVEKLQRERRPGEAVN
jgi:hypothetical protein